jgi:hypothetical protein
MIEQIKKFRDYLDYIEEHYNNVQTAWKLIQDKCKNMHFIYDDNLFHQLNVMIKNHDLSKLSAMEFTQYRQYFFPTCDEIKNKELFKEAWQHHKENNDHHWQTWIKYDNNAKQEIALIHNIVDWVAMGIKFGDTACDYYEKNKEEINLPHWAEKYMYAIFKNIY